jgi:hypothetical protein
MNDNARSTFHREMEHALECANRIITQEGGERPNLDQMTALHNACLAVRNDSTALPYHVAQIVESMSGLGCQTYADAAAVQLFWSAVTGLELARKEGDRRKISTRGAGTIGRGLTHRRLASRPLRRS